MLSQAFGKVPTSPPTSSRQLSGPSRVPSGRYPPPSSRWSTQSISSLLNSRSLILSPRRVRLLAVVLFLALGYSLFHTASSLWSTSSRGFAHGAGSASLASHAKRREGYPSRSDRIYGANGMLTVDIPSSGRGRSHPFYELIDHAEKRWRRMLSSQSKTLAQAVKEYKRRYKLDPPKGFDDWYYFCQMHGVQIVDEYDQMMTDVLLHYALKPSEFISRMAELRGSDFSFTIDVNTDRVELTGPRWNATRAKQFGALYDSFRDDLPNDFSLVLTFSDHDTGSQVVADDQRKRAMELVQSGQYFDDDELRNYENPKRTPAWGWFKACLLDSPANERPSSEYVRDLHNYQGPKSFIFDHLPTMSFCDFPELKRLHGAMAMDYEDRSKSRLKPIMVHSKFPGDGSFQNTPMEGWKNVTEQLLMETLLWEDKTDRRIFWRGKTTGGFAMRANNPKDVQQDWKMSHRIRLHTMVNGLKGDGGAWWFNKNRNVMMPDGKKGFKIEERNDKTLAKAYMDVSVSDKPAQCNSEQFCNLIDETIKMSPRVHPDDTHGYRYMLDVDGNGWSSRFHRLLTTGSMVIKFTMFPEWCQSWLIPWFHYVPMKPDYSDVYDIASFFIGPTLANGTVDYSKGHDHLAQVIANNGKEFTMEHWTWQGMQAYNYRLILEIRRLHSLDRSAMTYRP